MSLNTVRRTATTTSPSPKRTVLVPGGALISAPVLVTPT
jgi:hypothetical protein